MKAPSADLVIDTNIFLAAAAGRASRQRLSQISRQRGLIYTQATLVEFQHVIKVVPKFSVFLHEHGFLTDYANLVDEESYLPRIEHAEAVLRNAPASKNGSIRDAHILACAWVYEADIWSHDRDFAGCGWPSWSTANLVAALGN